MTGRNTVAGFPIGGRALTRCRAHARGWKPAFNFQSRCSRAVAAIAACATAAAFCGCQFDKNEGVLMAAGGYGEIAIVVSDGDLEPVANQFARRLNAPIQFVIQEELPFDVDVYTPGKWKLSRNYKNIIFLVRWADGGPVTKEVARLVDETALARLRGGGSGLAQMKNPYARYQFGVLATGSDRNTLASFLMRKADTIRELIETQSRERIRSRFRHTGIHEELLARYWQKFRFLIEIPREYKENQVEPDDYPAIEWMRTAPSRGITLAWSDTSDPIVALADRDFLLDFRRQIGARVHNEELVDVSLVWSEASLDERNCVKLEGAWASQVFEGGGPFWSFFFADPQQSRVYCLDLLVLAPGRDKMDYFREMHAIAESFSHSAAAVIVTGGLASLMRPS